MRIRMCSINTFCCLISVYKKQGIIQNEVDKLNIYYLCSFATNYHNYFKTLRRLHTTNSRFPFPIPQCYTEHLLFLVFISIFQLPWIYIHTNSKFIKFSTYDFHGCALFELDTKTGLV